MKIELIGGPFDGEIREWLGGNIYMISAYTYPFENGCQAVIHRYDADTVGVHPAIILDKDVIPYRYIKRRQSIKQDE